MTKSILHISHHLGCFRDQQYILNRLGYKVINLKFYDNVFTVTKEVSKTFWKTYKDIINSCDYVLITDTSPISRCIFENFAEFKSKLIIWITNRFDYGMANELEYYSLFKAFINDEKVKITTSTFWEKIWCLKHNIDITQVQVINPLGKFDISLEKNIPNSTIFDEWYNINSNITEAEVYIPFYHNDNSYFNIKNYLVNHNIKVCNTTFKNPDELKQFKCYITLPDAFSKFSTFETIHLHLPVLLPSKKLLLTLSKTENYLFNLTGYGGAELLTEDLINLIEWYNPKFNNCRIYFNSFNEIPELIKNIDKQNMSEEFEKCSFIHENEILNKWKTVYETF